MISDYIQRSNKTIFMELKHWPFEGYDAEVDHRNRLQW